MTNASSLVLILGLLSGCGALDNCPDGQSEPILIKSGLTDLDAETFESAAPSGPLEPFPAKTALAFEHGLGFTPLFYEAKLSFARDGTRGADGGSIADTAGNQTLWDCIDSNVIVIRNDTCEKSFFVRVVASGRALHDEGDKCSRPE
jgi:hypothetical protein